jgi:hypothetical protein
VVIKTQIGFEGKAQPDEKAEHIYIYVSILKKAATQPSGPIWGFETACIKFKQVSSAAGPFQDIFSGGGYE